MNLIYDEDPDYIVVFGADHVPDGPEQMVKQHIEAAPAQRWWIRCRARRPTAFGCIDADESGRIRGFVEKPADPPRFRCPDQTFVSMGNYIFTTKVLIDAGEETTPTTTTRITTYGDIIPRLVADGMAGGLRLQRQPGARRDRARPRVLARRRDAWTRSTTRTWIWSGSTRCSTSTTTGAGRSAAAVENLAPAKFVNGGSAQESVGAGSIISAASVRNSVLSSNVAIDDGAIVEGSV